MRRILGILFLSAFVLSISSCRHKVDGEYTIKYKSDIYSYHKFFSVKEEIPYLLTCVDDIGENMVTFRVTSDYYKRVDRGDKIRVCGTFPVNMRYGIYWCDLRNYGY